MPTLRGILPASLILFAAGCGGDASPAGQARPAPGASPVPAASTVSAQIRIRAGTALSCNGAAAVPDGLFGVTAYAGASAAADPAWRDILLRSGIRWAGLPAHPTWLFGESLPAGFADGWADSAAAGERLDGPSPGYHIPRSVRGWRDLGIEPMVYLLGYPAQLDGGISADGKTRIPDFPRDIPAAARMWAEYVAWIRRADPALTWLHLGNESNAYWWKLQKYGKDYAEVFNAVAAAVKARNPGVRIGGPVPCWGPSWPPAQPGTADWYTWTQWTEPFIAASGRQLDFFDFHLYEAGPGVGDEEVQTVANAMWLATGERKPVLITEYGVYLKPEDLRSAARVWSRRIDPWQRQLMDFLDYQADTVLSLQPHDLFAEAGGQFTVLKGRDPADQHPLLRAYQVWMPFRGTRLDCASDQPAVRSFAARSTDPVSGRRSLAVVLVNTGDEPREAAIAIDGATVQGPARLRSLRLVARTAPLPAAQAGREGFQNAGQGGVNAGPAGDGEVPPAKPEQPVAEDGSRIEYAETVSDRMPGSVLLAPHETCSLEVALAGASAVDREAWIRTAFGDVVHRPFAAPGDTITVRFPAPAAGADSAALRLGLLGARAGDRVELTIDGTTVVLANTWFQEVALPRVPAGPVAAVLRLVARGSPEQRPQQLRLGSAVLACRGASAAAAAPSGPSFPPDAPVSATWSFVPRQPAPSGLEDPWSGAAQSITNLPLNEALVAGPAGDARLSAAARGGVERSPVDAIVFRAPRTGWYRIGCVGRLAARTNPTAGHALASLFILPHDGHAVREVAALPLNAAGGFGGHPQDLAWTGDVFLAAGWRVGLGLQVVSPGPANGGRAELELSRLSAGFLGDGR